MKRARKGKKEKYKILKDRVESEEVKGSGKIDPGPHGA